MKTSRRSNNPSSCRRNGPWIATVVFLLAFLTTFTNASSPSSGMVSISQFALHIGKTLDQRRHQQSQTSSTALRHHHGMPRRSLLARPSPQPYSAVQYASTSSKDSRRNRRSTSQSLWSARGGAASAAAAATVKTMTARQMEAFK